MPPRAVSPQSEFRAVVTDLSPSRGNGEKQYSTNGFGDIAKFL